MIDEMVNILGKENVLTEKEQLEKYSHDETAGFSAMPSCVVFPQNTKQVSEIMKLANKYRIPVTPRGGGSCKSAGAVPYPNGIVISLEKMNKIKEIDTDNLCCVVEPGVITGNLASEVEKYGLFYPPDPASLDTCSIGGNIAECAGGARTIKYGTTKDYVMGLELVLPTGEIISCGGKLVKNAVDYNLIGLIVGSEGTLAIITEAILKLLPLTKERVSLLIPFNNVSDSVNAVKEIMRNKIIPTTIEYMERQAIIVTEKFLSEKLPFTNADVQLLIELDGNDKSVIEKEYEKIGEIALKSNAIDVFVAEDLLQQNKLWNARRSISKALKTTGNVVSEDVVVPKSKIAELISNIKELSRKYELDIVNFGHLGDGNIHVNFLQKNLENKIFKEKLNKVLGELFQIVVNLGGTLSGEHGIGLAKKPYIHIAMTKEKIELMKRIKKTFDPNNILNPGKIFDI